MTAKDVLRGIYMRDSEFGGTICRGSNESKSRVYRKLECHELIMGEVIPERFDGT